MGKLRLTSPDHMLKLGITTRTKEKQMKKKENPAREARRKIFGGILQRDSKHFSFPLSTLPSEVVVVKE